MNPSVSLKDATRSLPKLDERDHCFVQVPASAHRGGADLIARVTAIKPPGSGDTGMAEER